jgi:hypothetical protein
VIGEVSQGMNILEEINEKGTSYSNLDSANDLSLLLALFGLSNVMNIEGAGVAASGQTIDNILIYSCGEMNSHSVC